MNSRTLLSLALATLCIVALGLGAATLTSTTDTGTTGFGNGDGTVGNGDGEQTDSEPDATERDRGEPVEQTQDEDCIAGYNATELTGFLLLFAFVVSMVVFIQQGSLMPAMITFPMLAIPLWFASLILLTFMGCAAPGAEMAAENVDRMPLGEVTEEENGSDGDGESAPLSVRFGMVGILAVIITALLLVALYIQRRDTDTVPDDPELERSVPDPEELGAVAGSTADDLEEEADFENAIYQAWKEMTDILDADSPETSTPREFAEEARSAGLAETDVTELTALFESVRYGTAEPTPAQEQRAIDTLRRIETTYEKGTEKSGEEQ